MKVILFTILLSLASSFNNSNIKHDYFLSSTTIEHNKANKSLEITGSYYTDDLEKAVEKKYKIKMALGTKKEHKEADQYLSKYFKENFILTVDNKVLEYYYLGKEVEVEKTYNYIEVLGVPSFKKINIESRMLLNVARKQENMFQVINNSKKKSVVLYYKKQKGQITF